MSLQLAEALKAQKKGFKLGLIDTKKDDIAQFVFTNKNGYIIDKDNWRRRVFNKAIEQTEIRRIRIHDLRHTYATLRVSKGDNIADVSNQLGHFSETFTMKIYYHWMPGKKKAEVDELDDQEFRDKNGSYDEAKQAV